MAGVVQLKLEMMQREPQVNKKVKTNSAVRQKDITCGKAAHSGDT